MKIGHSYTKGRNPLPYGKQEQEGTEETETSKLTLFSLLAPVQALEFIKNDRVASAAGRGQDETRKNIACRGQRWAGWIFKKPAPLAAVKAVSLALRTRVVA